LDVSGIAEASPALGGPAVRAWGGEARVRIGPDRIAGIVGVGYLPTFDFGVGNFTGSILRVPATAGVRARVVKRYLNLDADLALSAAFERYDGLSPHAPSAATRVTPGIELGVLVSPHSLFGLAPFASMRCAWFPVTQELATAPQGNLGNTPALWVGAELGMSLEL
jgi:hypothetical protein